MKYLLLYLSIVFFKPALGQKKDTVFLVKEIIDSPYYKRHYTFIDSGQHCIDSNKHIYSFEWLHTMFKSEYNAGVKELKEIKNNRKYLKNFPRQWIMLYKYKDDYYTYACNSSGHSAQYEITDSTFIWYTMEGPFVSKLIKPNYTSSKLTFTASSKHTRDVNSIEILDKNKGIAIFTNYSINDRQTYRSLLIDVTKVLNFKIIVDYCLEEEECDFLFDEIDFLKLKKSYAQH